MPKLSIVVPAYNVEAFIERCIRSLLDQSLPGVEIIAVDDGSTDGTGDYLEAIHQAHPDRIRVLRKETSGSPASPRNAGLSASTAEWIGFVDGDDWASPDMFRQLHVAAERYKPDVAVCSGRHVDAATGEERPFQDVGVWRRLLAEHKEAIRPLDTPDLFLVDTSVCRRLYRRGFLHAINFRFADGFLFEDVAANYEILLRARRVALVDHDGYFYRTGHVGRITARRDKGILDGIEMVDRAAAALAKYGASADIWANFVRFQAWVLTWLAGQIEPDYAHDFAQRAVGIAKQFPAAGIRRFKSRYHSQSAAVIAVCLQCRQSGGEFYKFAIGELPSQVRESCLRWGDPASDEPGNE